MELLKPLSWKQLQHGWVLAIIYNIISYSHLRSIYCKIGITPKNAREYKTKCHKMYLVSPHSHPEHHHVSNLLCESSLWPLLAFYAVDWYLWMKGITEQWNNQAKFGPFWRMRKSKNKRRLTWGLLAQQSPWKLAKLMLVSSSCHQH